MDKNSRLSKEEKDFLKRYQSKRRHRFREIWRYQFHHQQSTKKNVKNLFPIWRQLRLCKNIMMLMVHQCL